MLPGLYDDQRPVYTRIAAMMIAGSLAVLPLTAQSSHSADATALHGERPDAEIATPQRLTFPDYSVTRDPFVPLQIDDTLAAQSAVPPSVGGARLRAIVLGDQARALVEIGGSVHVVGVGDRVGSVQVLQIGANALTLSDGTRLELDGRSQ
jgi:hypothetical protein